MSLDTGGCSDRGSGCSSLGPCSPLVHLKSRKKKKRLWCGRTLIFFKKATLTSFLIQYFDNLLFFGRAKWSFSEQNESSSARHFVPLSPVHLLHCPCCRRKRSPSQRCSQVPSSLSGIRSANSAAPWCTGRFRCTSLDSRL